MNMKKSLIAMAAAGVIAAPMAAQAAEVYGRVNVGIASLNDDAAPTTEAELSLQNVASRFGSKGSEDLGNGMTAHYQYEFGVDATEANLQSNNRIGKIGLSGDFGKVEAGKDWGAWYNYLCANVDWSWFTGNGAGCYGKNIASGRVNDIVRYSFGEGGPFQFSVEAQMSPSDNAPAAGSTENLDITTLGGNADAGPVNIQFASQSFAADTGPEPSATGIGVTWNGPFYVGATYVMEDPDDGSGSDPTGLSVTLSRGLGGGLVVHGGISQWDADTASGAGDESTVWATLDKSLSSRTGVYAEFISTSIDGGAGADSDPQTIIFAARHDF